MRIVRFIPKNKKEAPRYGWLSGEESIGVIEDNPFKTVYRRLETSFARSDVMLLAPLTPSKVICVGRNYADHAKEHGAEVPKVPIIFFKPPSSVIGPDEAIVLPPESKQVEHEAELAVVIRKRGRRIPPDEALDYVFGYTIANDVTARDLQFSDGQWTRGKGFDTFCPLGPWIETEFDPSDVMIECHVNDQLRQMASTRDMVFRVNQLIAFTSNFMTLEPADVILTGTPAGVGPLNDKDTVVVSIRGIGELSNRVVKEVV